MLVNTDIPKGIGLFRIPPARDRASYNPSVSEFVPILEQGRNVGNRWQGDATLSAYWSRAATGPRAPLADGNEVNMHIQNEPRSVTFTAIVSDFTTFPGQVSNVIGRPRRSVGLFATLQAWVAGRTRIAALGSFETIPEGYISQLGTPQAAGDGMAIICELVVTQIQRYSTNEIPNIEDSAVRLGAVTQIVGGTVVG